MLLWLLLLTVVWLITVQHSFNNLFTTFVLKQFYSSPLLKLCCVFIYFWSISVWKLSKKATKTWPLTTARSYFSQLRRLINDIYCIHMWIIKIKKHRKVFFVYFIFSVYIHTIAKINRFVWGFNFLMHYFSHWISCFTNESIISVVNYCPVVSWFN